MYGVIYSMYYWIMITERLEDFLYTFVGLDCLKIQRRDDAYSDLNTRVGI